MLVYENKHLIKEEKRAIIYTDIDIHISVYT